MCESLSWLVYNKCAIWESAPFKHFPKDAKADHSRGAVDEYIDDIAMFDNSGVCDLHVIPIDRFPGPTFIWVRVTAFGLIKRFDVDYGADDAVNCGHQSYECEDEE